MSLGIAQMKIRLSDVTKAAIEGEAKRNRRSLNGQVVYMLELLITRPDLISMSGEPVAGNASEA